MLVRKVEIFSEKTGALIEIIFTEFGGKRVNMKMSRRVFIGLHKQIEMYSKALGLDLKKVKTEIKQIKRDV